MVADKQNQALIDLIDIIRDKSSVFCYSDKAEAKKLLSVLAQEFQTTYALPAISIDWNENENISKSAHNNITSFYLYRNYTSTLIKTEKMLALKKHIIILTDISALPAGEKNKPYIHFLSILLRKCEEYEGTILAIASEKDMNNDIVPLFTNRFLLKEKKMKKTDDPSINFRYESNGDNLRLTPYTQSDINKLKEIFSLTPEEKEELDRLVGQSLEEYRASM